MPSEAVIVIDVQDCFLPPSGTLATTNSRNGSFGANALGEAIASFVNKKSDLQIYVSKDWHPSGHTSFAKAEKGEKPFNSRKGAYTNAQFSAAEEKGGKRFWGAEGRHDQTLWPAHCLQNEEGSDAKVADSFMNKLSPENKGKIVNIIKGFDPAIDSYSVIADATGNFTPKNEDTGDLFKDTLVEAAMNLDTIYVTGIARNVCVFTSFMDILNYVTVPQFKSGVRTTKVVFMYNLTRPVAPGMDMTPKEIEGAATALLTAMDVPADRHAELFEVRGDGASYNAAGGRRNQRQTRRRQSQRQQRQSQRQQRQSQRQQRQSQRQNQRCRKNHRHTSRCQ